MRKTYVIQDVLQLRYWDGKQFRRYCTEIKQYETYKDAEVDLEEKAIVDQRPCTIVPNYVTTKEKEEVKVKKKSGLDVWYDEYEPQVERVIQIDDLYQIIGDDNR